jgi:O-antigen ligase
MRGAEETGRLIVWPLILEKFLDSPLVGVGASNAGAVVPSSGKFITPHNSFLLFAVASGIIPLGLFVSYCYRSGMAALRACATDRDSIYYLPLVVYAVLVAAAGNMDFMTPWSIMSLALPLAASDRRMKQGQASVLHHAGAAEEIP